MDSQHHGPRGFYGPAHIIRPEVLSAEAGAVILQQDFQYALQNSLMYEALIALAQANLTIQHRLTNGPEKTLYTTTVVQFID